MFEKIANSKDVIMKVVEDNSAIDCIAIMGDKLLIGVAHGQKTKVIRSVEDVLTSAGLDFATGWDVTISRYPTLVVRSREWVFDREAAVFANI